tara:strand:+ start:661 stop:993 length:333 start_codon:yes stop_codon:yes gene_type:complete
MATVKVKAPVGHHFMVRESDNDFYVMKTHYTGYKKHTAGDYSSALSVDVRFEGEHVPTTTTQRRATATTSTGRTTTTRTITNNRSTSVSYPSRTTSSSRSSSSGSGSSGY